MAEVSQRRGELRRGARRGAGWALGFGAVVAAASVLRQGPQPALKASMKQVLRMRRAGAELSEQMQDLYAEAQAEYAVEVVTEDQEEM